MSATPKGLRYEASDGKDNFLWPLADIAAFDLDYLAKNLRVRMKDGKTFNFTDTAPTSWRCFIKT